jgi:hypothetical protein
MNPLHWKRDDIAALIVFCAVGALGGLAFAWLDSPMHSLCQHSISGEWSNCTRVLLMWLQHPSIYWSAMLSGALVPGLAFYGFQLGRG